MNDAQKFMINELKEIKKLQLQQIESNEIFIRDEFDKLPDELKAKFLLNLQEQTVTLKEQKEKIERIFIRAQNENYDEKNN
jgi:hypothetical protein